MHLHLFHFVRVELLFDALRERGSQAAPCRGLTSSIIDRGREGVVDREVRRERQALRWRGLRPVGECRRVRAEHSGQGGCGRIRVAEEAPLWGDGTNNGTRLDGILGSVEQGLQVLAGRLEVEHSLCRRVV